MNFTESMEEKHYTKEFYDSLQGYSRQSAEVIVPLVVEAINPNRVIDVGCGDGTWLKVFQESGVKEILGIDGEYVNEETLIIPKQDFVPFDLKQPFRLEKEFDLVLSLEVAEHLPETCAETFVETLTNLGRVVLFSAAIPGQGGENHINEQWQDYWIGKFQDRNYIAIDYIRKKVWDDPRVAYWYSQNTFLFIQKDYFDENHILRQLLSTYKLSENVPCSVVHPTLFLIKAGILNYFENESVPAESNVEAKNSYSAFSLIKKGVKGLLKRS
jgi:SAM-dependent methyltransferase